VQEAGDAERELVGRRVLDNNKRIMEARSSLRLRAGKACNRLVNSWGTMKLDLQYVLEILRSHESDLRRLGVSHAAVFGSVARGEAGAKSDIDVLVELDENRPMGVFEYAKLKLYINELLDGPSDVVNRRTLKPLLRASILHDMVHAF
jgi:predicted nucleotidyltransferase